MKNYDYLLGQKQNALTAVDVVKDQALKSKGKIKRL